MQHSETIDHRACLASGFAGATQRRPDASARTRQPLPENFAIIFGGAASAEWWPRFKELDQITAGPEIELQRKFGLGPLAPIVALSGGAIWRWAWHFMLVAVRSNA